MVATVRSPSPKCYRMPIYNFVSFDYIPILNSKMGSIVLFTNYGDVKQIHVNTI